MIARDPDQELLPACDHLGLSPVPYSSLAEGFLTGKYRQGVQIPLGVRGHGDKRFREI